MGFFLLMIFIFVFTAAATAAASTHKSILGDSKMRNPYARFALEAWDACNQVGDEAPPPGMGSPRMADCADLNCSKTGWPCNVIQRVQDSDNSLKPGDRFGNSTFNSSANVEKYAEEKEKYLGSLCERTDNNITWYFWKIMVKNGNLDNSTGICPENGRKVRQGNGTLWGTKFPCFGPGCMNQPLMYRNASKLENSSSSSLTGGFYGTYDVNNATLVLNNGTQPGANNSYFAVSWQKANTTANKSSWNVSFTLKTSPNYPWLKLLLRADATNGSNAGYFHDGRGIMKASSLPQSPNFKVRLTLQITQGGGVGSQFYITDMEGCLKNNGNPCDGNVTTDVTRHVQMIINPSTPSACNSGNLIACPPYHVNPNTGQKIYKNDTANFPYNAYHQYCAPGNAQHLNDSVNICDPYTNPQAQELMQLLPHSVWYPYGFPYSTIGWESPDPKYWELNAGKLSQNLYFYQDPTHQNATHPKNATEPKPPSRIWNSISIGTEMYNLDPIAQQTAEWSVSDFDVVVPK